MCRRFQRRGLCKFGAACFYARSHVDNFCIATPPFAESDEESDEMEMAADKDVSNGAVLQNSVLCELEQGQELLDGAYLEESGGDADKPDRFTNSGPRSAAKVERALAAAGVVESSPENVERGMIGAGVEEKVPWNPKFCEHCGTKINYT